MLIPRLVVMLLLFATTPPAAAAVYDLPAAGNDIIGHTSHLSAKASDTLSALARRYDLGYNELRQANPNVDAWLPGAGTPILLPTEHLLPDAPRHGVVLNLAEMRLYYYPPKGSPYAGKVITYPLGIGRQGWNTPLATTRIVRKIDGPDWRPTQSILAEHKKNGDPLPDVVPAGPDNPLGQYALRLALPQYLIHGTNKPSGIGLRVSHGCIRLYPEDIAALYSMVRPGTPVRIVNQPYKAGWRDGELYLEVHPPDADGKMRVKTYTPMVQTVISATRDKPDFPVDWQRAARLGRIASGVPRPIGSKRVAAKP